MSGKSDEMYSIPLSSDSDTGTNLVWFEIKFFFFLSLFSFITVVNHV